MRHLFYLTLLALFLASCNNSPDAKQLKELMKQRDEISKTIEKSNEQLSKINEEIAKLQKIDNRQFIQPYTVVSQPFQHTIALQSSISTEQDVMIYPEFAGTLTWNVSEGQHVAKGQVIGSINDGGISSQLKQAQIQADLAKTAFEKQSRLWKEQIGSEIQYLQSKTNYEAAQKSIAVIQSQLGRTKVRAPFSGTIDNLMMQSGQAVAPGIPIAKIVNIGNLKVTADVSEKYIAQVKRGTLANIEIPTLNTTIQGRVGRVSNSINPNNRTFSIEIPINNQGGQLKPNMTTKINLIDYQSANTIAIPNEAIRVNAAGEKFVYKLSNINGKSAKVVRAIIKTGSTNSNFTEVVSGLNVGEMIVREGSKGIVENTSVKF